MPATPTSRIIIQDLPAGTAPEELVTQLNKRFRDLEQTLKTVVVQQSLVNVDVGEQRIVKLADPTDDTDAVNLRTLKRGQGGRRQEQQDSTPSATVTDQHLGVVFVKDGFVADEEESPWWTVDEFREGYPISALVTAAGAPSSETLKVNFKVLRVGAIDTEFLLTLPLEIEVDKNGPTYSDLGLVITDKLPKGTQIRMLIVKGGDAEKVVGQIVLRRAL